MRLIHLTDPHLSNLDSESLATLRGKRWSGYLSWRKNRQKRYLPAVLDQLETAVRQEGADQILLTGDLIQIGLDSEIRQARDWLAGFSEPGKLMMVPGNHDIYASGSENTVHKAWSDYLFPENRSGSGGRFPVLRKIGKLSLIGLSTACVTPLFMASGTLGQDQLDSLSELLEQAADEEQLVCLLIHHPPLPGMTHWRKGLSDAGLLKNVLQTYPPLLMFHGHLHHNREQHWGDSRIYCTAAASSASDASYRVIDIEEHADSWAFRMRLESIALDEPGDLAFVTVDEQSWQVRKNRT
jgi:3',5'-cyclic AMP phosphodiesterase CpdA